MRITWFGDKCFRVSFSAREFVFYPEKATYDVSQNELVGLAESVSLKTLGPFGPLVDVEAPASGSRLIDVMDDPETYLADQHAFVMDAQPDERLVMQYLHAGGSPNIESWLAGAVVLFVGKFKDCLSALEGMAGKSGRQVLLAVVDLDDVSIEKLTAKAGSLRVQLLEPGFAVEL